MEDYLQNNNTYEANERIKTGVNELDNLIQGGFPKGSFIVATGTAGSGKTIFGCQFITEGIKNDEKCLYISAEQTSDEIVEQAKQFGWDFNNWEKEGKLRIISLLGKQLFETKAIDEIKVLMRDTKYNRVVFDSITSILNAPFSKYNIADGADRGLHPQALSEISRANITEFIDFIKQNGITTLGVAQKIEGLPGETIDNVSEFKADGLVVFNSTAVGKNLNRTIQVKKLRKTKIDGIPHRFDFTENGILLTE